MLSVTHSLISLPLGIYLGSPLFIFAAAIVFHLLVDTLPHWNIYPDQMKRYPFVFVALDVFGGIWLAWLLTGTQFWSLPILAAVIGGNMPDVLHGLWDLLSPSARKRSPHWVQAWFSFHNKLQLETVQALPGLIPQALLIAVALMLLP